MTFRLAQLSAGANPLYWDTLQDLLGEADIPIEPDATYNQNVVALADGQKRLLGFPYVTWSLTLTGMQKYILRQICPYASASVYIETPTNNYDANGAREWTQAQAIMNWTEDEENIDADITLDIVIRFTHLVEIEE